MDTFVCSDCGVTKPIPEEGGTGYAQMGKQLICYDCCAQRDIKYMHEHDKISLYLTRIEDGLWYVTNWPGTMKLRVTYLNESETAGFGNGMQRRDVRFIGPDAKLWYGRNQGNNQLVRCRRMKERK